MYKYRCVIRRIVDGDTVDVDIDLGFGVWLSNRRIRLTGIDAPEVRTRDLMEKEAGFAAKDYVEARLPVGSNQVLISREFKGKYGRIIGDFEVYDGEYDAIRNLTELILRDKHAILYK